MRILIALFTGVLIGALVAFTLANTLHQRNAYARGVMAIAQHHYAELRRTLRTPQCPIATVVDTLPRLRAAALEIEPAFVDGPAQDAGFRQRAQTFLAEIDGAIAAPPADCAALNALVRALDDQCEACHADYR
jgi:hypothetical protein